ncbi:hypothetical protein MmTuc01_2300 [Methanosarcina mazei Tuc01]|uniref:Uncharacterized protein n=1 Tax=Methanosarcina mazei Tuc01 TaxID=1236903 RepID=M1PAR7_METMZ|nr:hypothetical protein MmTuc01_2300 [Methanosarcina mazei Tuc01]
MVSEYFLYFEHHYTFTATSKPSQIFSEKKQQIHGTEKR